MNQSKQTSGGKEDTLELLSDIFLCIQSGELDLNAGFNRKKFDREFTRLKKQCDL